MRDYQDNISDLRFVVKEVNNTTELPDMLTLYFQLVCGRRLYFFFKGLKFLETTGPINFWTWLFPPLSFFLSHWCLSCIVLTRAQFHKACKLKNLLSTEKYCLTEIGYQPKCN